MKLNEKYSYKSWKRKTYTHLSAAEFDGEIIGACFHQDTPYTDVFPAGIRTTFVNTNLDNCNIPPGATVGTGCTNKFFAKQNNQEYYLVDSRLRPIVPRNEADFIKCGLSTSPADIPPTPLAEPITWTHDPERIKAEKIAALSQDTARLEQILRDAGEITGAAKPIGEIEP